jgi:hypothetical protein
VTAPLYFRKKGNYASENGYKWSAQLQAGYRHEFLVAVREYMVRTTVQETIRGF